MYPIPTPNQAAPESGYVPYFYQAGLHLRYALPSLVSPAGAYESHREAIGIADAPSLFRDADRIQTVEDVIARGYFAVPTGDPVMAMISDRKHTSGMGLDDAISQIRQRYEIYEQNLYQIELAKCAAINAIYHHEAYGGPGSASARQHYAKHKAIQGLYEQERLERTALWKDISRLKTMLPESAQQYLTAHRKMSVLAQEPGGGW